MTKRLIVLMGLAGTASFLYADALWDKAVACYTNGSEIRAQKMTSVSEERSGDDHLEKTTKIDYRMEYGSDGSVNAVILSATENGKDVTREKREEQEKRKKEGRINITVSSEDQPLHEKSQARITLTKKKGYASIQNKRCVMYAFSLKTTDGKQNLTGTAYIEKDSGIPVRLVYTMDPRPQFTDKIIFSVDYRMYSDKAAVVSRFVVTGEGGFLFVRKKIKSVTTFEYFNTKDDLL